MAQHPDAAAILAAFPDYDGLDTFPAIPAPFACEAWRQDASPVWRYQTPEDHEGNGAVMVEIWADYADPAKREIQGPRFTVHIYDDTHHARTGGRTIHQSDDGNAAVQEALACAIGTAFAGMLKAQLTPAQWAEMRERNIGAGDLVCHSHDYCDANMPMASAFEAVMGRPILPEGDDAEMAEADCVIWNAAWDYAKRNFLTEGR